MGGGCVERGGGGKMGEGCVERKGGEGIWGCEKRLSENCCV